MIKVTKLNQETVYVNSDLIEFVEASPDTALIFQGGKRVIVRESVDEIVENILKYKKFVHSNISIKKE